MTKLSKKALRELQENPPALVEVTLYDETNGAILATATLQETLIEQWKASLPTGPGKVFKQGPSARAPDPMEYKVDVALPERPIVIRGPGDKYPVPSNPIPPPAGITPRGKSAAPGNTVQRSSRRNADRQRGTGAVQPDDGRSDSKRDAGRAAARRRRVP